MLIQAEPLRRLVECTFMAAGCPEDESGRIARYLVKSNLTGHDSHGVIRVPRYLDWMGEGRVKPNQQPRLVMDNEVMAVVDGNFGFGQTIGPQAVQLGIEKALKSGLSIVALRRSGHLGRIGDWAEMAAAAELVSIHFVNVSGSRLVAPFGGRERRMSTNPIAIGIPRPGEPPIILDFATSIVAEGKVVVAYKGGKALPAGSLIDGDGNLSADPAAFYGGERVPGSPDLNSLSGAIRAMGEHKGSGLAFMNEMLAGALTGSGCAGPGERPFNNGMLSIYMSPAVFASDHDFAAEVREYTTYFKSAKPAAADGEVLIPGEPEQRNERTRLAEGIPLPDETWEAILDGARRAGLSAADIDEALGVPATT